MDPVSPLTPTLRIDKLQLFQENKQQPPPFNRGQILQGLITEKKHNQFTLEVEGRQFMAESKAPLQIGQRLELQVTSLSPRFTLQILTDPLMQYIGKSLHLLPTENTLLPQASTLAASLPANTLSSASQQALAFFATLMTPPSRGGAGFAHQAGGELARLLSSLFTPGNADIRKDVGAEVANFLDKFIQTLPQQQPNTPMAQLLLRELNNLGQDLSAQQLFVGGKSAERDGQLNALMQKIGQLPAAENIGHTLAETFSRIFGNEKASSPSSLLIQLLNLTTDLLQKESIARKTMPTGRELEQFAGRLGTNLEQLLATGKQDEATFTFKSALLDIRHALTDNTHQHQADQLLSTLQLYQLLQIRLAGEAIFFLPLPLPSFNQGYLLVEPDQQQNENTTNQGEPDKKYSLHLSLEGLGNLNIELQQQARGIRLRFYAEDTTRAKFLAQNREELTGWLTAAEIESVQFLTGAKDPTKKLLSLMFHGSSGMLNTRV